MEWDLIKVQSGISIGRISHHTSSPAKHGRDVVRLQPSLLKEEYPMGDVSKHVATFINQFMAIKGEFPKGKFWALGWVHSSDKYWWSRMISFVLEELEKV